MIADFSTPPWDGHVLQGCTRLQLAAGRPPDAAPRFASLASALSMPALGAQTALHRLSDVGRL